MLAARVLDELRAQHDELRTLIDRCDDLAAAVDDGRAGPLELTAAVARLRETFAAHIRHEEKLLRPVLLDEAHVGEHRTMRNQLETDPLREILDILRAHLDAEDRYFATR